MKIKTAIQEFLRPFGYGIHRVDDASLLPKADTSFLRLYLSFKDHTLVSVDRCFNIYQLALATRHISGDIAELGVYRGGTAKMLAEICPDKTIHLFDTFDGLPDAEHKGEFADTSLEEVEQYLDEYGNVKLYKGFFPGTATDVARNTFSFVYLDADIGSSTLDGLRFFYPRLATGGMVVIDDYGQERWPDIKPVVDEFALQHGLQVLSGARYQAYLIKI